MFVTHSHSSSSHDRHMHAPANNQMNFRGSGRPKQGKIIPGHTWQACRGSDWQQDSCVTDTLVSALKRDGQTDRDMAWSQVVDNSATHRKTARACLYYHSSPQRSWRSFTLLPRSPVDGCFKNHTTHEVDKLQPVVRSKLTSCVVSLCVFLCLGKTSPDLYLQQI